MTKLQEILALNIKNNRKKRGLSQTQLAEKAGTSTNYISLIECGLRFPSPQMIEKIAEVFGLKDFELFAPHPITEVNVLDLYDSVVEKVNAALKDAFKEL